MYSGKILQRPPHRNVQQTQKTASGAAAGVSWGSKVAQDRVISGPLSSKTQGFGQSNRGVVVSQSAPSSGNHLISGSLLRPTDRLPPVPRPVQVKRCATCG